MFFLFGYALAMPILIAQANKVDELNRVLTGMEETRGKIKTLVVEFQWELKDRVFNTSQKAKGVFRLARDPAGKMNASYEFRPEKLTDENPMFSALLMDSQTIAVFFEDQKTEVRLKIGEQRMLGFLEDFFNPLTILFDPPRAEKYCTFAVSHDEFYTYLNVKATGVPRSSIFGWPRNFDGRLVQMKSGSSAIPKGMPCQIWIHDGRSGNEVKFDITRWSMNRADGPTVEDLTNKTARQGWKVVEWK